MRSLGSVAGMLVVVLVALLVWKYFLTSGQSVGANTPVQTIDAVGAQNDLIGIAQAERSFQAQTGRYASLDQLTSDDALPTQLRKPSRQGYTYDVETSDDGFRATAICSSTLPGCHSYSIDQTMTVQLVP
ncbi:MAG TPA: hypothetical protein VMB02_11395 [Candidatus Aquilonibacter sp.]|nr:hypothetical protein [Candidatus Aquilonibacter sp.]